MILLQRKEANALARLAGTKIPLKTEIGGGWETLLSSGAKLKVWKRDGILVYAVSGYHWRLDDELQALVPISFERTCVKCGHFHKFAEEMKINGLGEAYCNLCGDMAPRMEK